MIHKLSGCKGPPATPQARERPESDRAQITVRRIRLYRSPDVPLHLGVFCCVKADTILHVINVEVNSDAS